MYMRYRRRQKFVKAIQHVGPLRQVELGLVPRVRVAQHG